MYKKFNTMSTKTENKNIFDMKRVKAQINFLIDICPIGIMEDGEFLPINGCHNLYYMTDEDDRLYYYHPVEDDIWDITRRISGLSNKCTPDEWISRIYFKNGWGQCLLFIDHLHDLDSGKHEGLR
jgi:hypothetical protein